MSVFLNQILALAEKSLIPDWLIRYGIRNLCRKRNAEISRKTNNLNDFIDKMKNGPIAPIPDVANEQHYEVPAAFFERVLGPNRKYSGCLWENQTVDLGQAEAASLEQVCQRAEIQNGHSILELGCGWGSLTLWMAKHFPNSTVVAVSNSTAQKQLIEAKAVNAGLDNVEVITADMNDFQTDRQFDRIVSIEMFEHMRNWKVLLNQISHWLKEQGKLFIHVFSNASFAYEFLSEGASNWMGRYFFSGGLMPSHDLIKSFNDDLSVTHEWTINGVHYARTAEAWLKNLDNDRQNIRALMVDNYGKDLAGIWLQRWRIFFMACAELFQYDNGKQWQISHYLLEKRFANV
ncbi:MAG: cyclopropane-fatty-acyl-phospholipid synthase family protein [Planctomycetota bacterium]|nr:cyclopropane-fatty-acyl-phospholipid synthase family protein [Planctomycetota bacterium]